MRQNKKARDGLKKIDHEGGFSQEKAQVVKVSFPKIEKAKSESLTLGPLSGRRKANKKLARLRESRLCCCSEEAHLVYSMNQLKPNLSFVETNRWI